MSFIGRLIQKAHKHGISYTSLDAMKLFAIVNMTADHIGEFLFPDQLWWRAIGRTTTPVWFFLVGYSRSQKLNPVVWWYGLAMMVAQPFLGFPIFPVNVLVAVIICRLILNFCENRRWLPGRMPELIVASIIASLATMPLFEYGTIALLFAVLGKMVRDKETRYLKSLSVFGYALFIAWMEALFQFEGLELAYVCLSTAWVVEWLSRCPNKVIWADWTESRYKKFITVLSRNTIPYYFYHRLILQILSAFLLGKGIVFTLKFFP
jgi:hypothetical protein